MATDKEKLKLAEVPEKDVKSDVKLAKPMETPVYAESPKSPTDALPDPRTSQDTGVSNAPAGSGSGDKFDNAITPSLFKMPMSKERKHDRRIMDFEKFLKAINYRTHDGVLQKGHGQNLTGRG